VSPAGHPTAFRRGIDALARRPHLTEPDGARQGRRLVGSPAVGGRPLEGRPLPPGLGPLLNRLTTSAPLCRPDGTQASTRLGPATADSLVVTLTRSARTATSSSTASETPNRPLPLHPGARCCVAGVAAADLARPKVAGGSIAERDETRTWADFGWRTSSSEDSAARCRPGWRARGIPHNPGRQGRGRCRSGRGQSADSLNGSKGIGGQGWATPTWPTRIGGRPASPARRRAC